MGIPVIKIDFLELCRYNPVYEPTLSRHIPKKYGLDIDWVDAEGITNCLMSLDLSYDPLSKLNSDILIERLQAEAFLQVRKAHQLKAYFDKMKELGKEVNMPQDRKQQAVYAVILSSA